jgi:hypothetical protein
MSKLISMLLMAAVLAVSSGAVLATDCYVFGWEGTYWEICF